MIKMTEEQIALREIQYKTLEECYAWVEDFDGIPDTQSITNLIKQRISELEANYKTKAQK